MRCRFPRARGDRPPVFQPIDGRLDCRMRTPRGREGFLRLPLAGIDPIPPGSGTHTCGFPRARGDRPWAQPAPQVIAAKT